MAYNDMLTYNDAESYTHQFIDDAMQKEIKRYLNGKKAIILYTFDYKSEHVGGYMMLCLSILTVIRELGDDVLIIVFSTEPNVLKQRMERYLEKIRIFPFNRVRESDNFSDCSEYFSTIGHARVFLIPELLDLSNVPVIYLDNDTGIGYGRGHDILEELNRPYPCGYICECQNIDILVQNYNRMFGTNIRSHPISVSIPGRNILGIKTDSLDIRTTDITNINNGFLFVPNNELGRKVAANQLNVYMHLHKINPIFFNDMFAFSIVINHWSKLLDFSPCTYNHNFCHSDQIPVRFPIDYNNRFCHIVHYYDKKCSISIQHVQNIIDMIEKPILDGSFVMVDKKSSEMFKFNSILEPQKSSRIIIGSQSLPEIHSDVVFKTADSLHYKITEKAKPVQIHPNPASEFKPITLSRKPANRNKIIILTTSY